MLERRPLAADLNDALHVAALCSNQSASHLKLLVVVNLNVKPTSVFDVVILTILLLIALRLLVTLILVVSSLLLLVLSVNILIRELTHAIWWQSLLVPIRVRRLLEVKWFLLNLDVFLV